MEDTREVNLEALLARLANGDRSAFTLVFKRLQEPILRLCMSMLKNEADARDATLRISRDVISRFAVT